MTPSKFLTTWGPSGVVCDFEAGTVTYSFDQLETAIAAAIREAVEQEREECAKIAEAQTGSPNWRMFGAASAEYVAGEIADAIRARSATSPSDTAG